MEAVIGIAVSLFFIMDPIGNIPVIAAMIKDYTPSRQRFIIVRESVIALIIMVIFMFFGKSILSALGVAQEALNMTGGMVLFLIGVRMSFPSSEGIEGLTGSSAGGDMDSEPLVVPIAIPFIAGPGLIGTLMFLADKAGNIQNGLLSLLIAWTASTVLLAVGPFVMKLLGQRGMEACTRLMGLALTAMAVQMFMTGFRDFMK